MFLYSLWIGSSYFSAAHPHIDEPLQEGMQFPQCKCIGGMSWMKSSAQVC